MYTRYKRARRIQRTPLGGRTFKLRLGHARVPCQHSRSARTHPWASIAWSGYYEGTQSYFPRVHNHQQNKNSFHLAKHAVDRLRWVGGDLVAADVLSARVMRPGSVRDCVQLGVRFRCSCGEESHVALKACLCRVPRGTVNVDRAGLVSTREARDGTAGGK